MKSSNQKPECPDKQFPQHVAVIMDGNGRWAKARGWPRIAGHRKGVEIVRDLVQYAAEKEIPYLTLFAFSSENWRRPAIEVRLLMDLFGRALKREVARLHSHGIRFCVIGDSAALGSGLSERVRAAEALTAGNQRLRLTVAVNYGGRWDIAQAAAALARRACAGDIDPQDITPDLFAAHLCMADLPEPDLFIRTGGEQRISNFLLWQLAYTELYFTPTLWPDFVPAEFEKALQSYGGRQRRFGRTGDQVDVPHV